MHYRSLGDAYWSLMTGRPRTPRKWIDRSRRFQWRLLLSYRTGLIEMPQVTRPNAQPSKSAAAVPSCSGRSSHGYRPAVAGDA
jgi:hypothetical protein